MESGQAVRGIAEWAGVRLGLASSFCGGRDGGKGPESGLKMLCNGIILPE